MTTNLHEMFGLPDKKVDYKARLIAATEHMRSEVKDVFRELGLQEDDPCQRWSGFLKSLARRGLRGVKLVITDAHEGLKAAIRRVFSASWQRCRVHWMRNALSYVAKTQQSMVAAALRQAFIQPDREREIIWCMGCAFRRSRPVMPA